MSFQPQILIQARVWKQKQKYYRNIKQPNNCDAWKYSLKYKFTPWLEKKVLEAQQGACGWRFIEIYVEEKPFWYEEN